MNALPGVAEPLSHDQSHTVPLASWYTQSVSDGFGDRLLMSDNTSGSSLELLRFRPDLAEAPGFERTLRDAVARLADFEHAAFARVRAVTELDSAEGGLALVSTHIPGRRLSEMFQGAPRRGNLHPAFVAWLIRWLTPALADFHDRTGEAHGAITPERIALAPDGRPVLLECVLGRPVEQLRLSNEGLWRLFGIAVPSTLDRGKWLSGRTDVFQLASISLSLLLGRKVTPTELAMNLDSLLDEFVESEDARASSLTPVLRLWLERALRIDRGGFRSAREACADIRQLSQAPRPDMLRLNSRFDRTSLSDEMDRLPSSVHQATAENRRDASTAARHESPVGWFSARNMAVCFAVMAVAEGVFIGLLLRAPPADGRTPLLPIRIHSRQAGDVVMLDGREIGVTPLELTVGAAMQTISVVSPLPLASALLPMAAGMVSLPSGTVDQMPAIAAPAAPPESGIRLIAPVALEVFDGTHVVGSSLDGRIVLPPGTYQLEFVNAALDYRSQQTVEVRSGEVTTLEVHPPGGRISVNASPWALVWLDGQPVGETPIAYLPVAAGEHEIVFRHPELGEHRQTLTVKPGAETRISATFVP